MDLVKSTLYLLVTINNLVPPMNWTPLHKTTTTTFAFLLAVLPQKSNVIRCLENNGDEGSKQFNSNYTAVTESLKLGYGSAKHFFRSARMTRRRMPVTPITPITHVLKNSFAETQPIHLNTRRQLKHCKSDNILFQTKDRRRQVPLNFTLIHHQIFETHGCSLIPFMVMRYKANHWLLCYIGHSVYSTHPKSYLSRILL